MPEKRNNKLKKHAKAHTIYKNSDGMRVPGTTTIMSILAKPALIKWANDLGLEGIEYTKYLDVLADVGTLAHKIVECYFTQEKVDYSNYSKNVIEKAENCIKSFNAWTKSHTVDPIENELQLVSEQFQFGGTIDCYCKINGEVYLLDFKTGKALYDEQLIQLSAYMQLLNENGYPCHKAKILRIGRSEGEGFEERELTNFARYWQIFDACNKIYKLKKEIERG